MLAAFTTAGGDLSLRCVRELVAGDERDEIFPQEVALEQTSLQAGWASAVTAEALSLPSTPSLVLAGYVLLQADDVWTLRTPYFGVASHTLQVLVVRFGAVAGPYRLGLSAATEAAARLGRETAEIGLDMAAQYMEHVERGRAVDDAETWAVTT